MELLLISSIEKSWRIWVVWVFCGWLLDRDMVRRLWCSPLRHFLVSIWHCLRVVSRHVHNCVEMGLLILLLLPLHRLFEINLRLHNLDLFKHFSSTIHNSRFKILLFLVFVVVVLSDCGRERSLLDVVRRVLIHKSILHVSVMFLGRMFMNLVSWRRLRLLFGKLVNFLGILYNALIFLQLWDQLIGIFAHQHHFGLLYALFDMWLNPLAQVASERFFRQNLFLGLWFCRAALF